MTATEFKNEFNEFYDGLASNNAPALDDYTISVLLTRSQEELVKTKFDEMNQKGKGFEQSSKRRSDLKNLIKQYTATNSSTIVTDNIEEGTTFYIIPSDVFLIIQESAIIEDSTCNGQDKYVSVVPKTHDEYNVQRLNPFKKPDENTVWRLDFNNLSGNNVVELYSSETIVSYKLRYIKKPLPIIVSDLTAVESGLSIDSYTAARTSELESTVHIEIVKRAAEMGILSFRENNLNNNIQFNQRVE